VRSRSPDPTRPLAALLATLARLAVLIASACAGHTLIRTHALRRGLTASPAMTRVAGTFATALALAAAAPAAAGQPGLATIAFQAATASGNQYTRTTAGTFTMTGPLADTGTLRTSYRFAGPRIDATTTLIGARGIFTLSLRGASGATVFGHQSGAGRWRVRGGAGAYSRLHGHGRWQADADFGTAPPGMLPPTIRGALIGRLYHSSALGHAGSRAQHYPRC
jgi:hypothetical protein